MDLKSHSGAMQWCLSEQAQRMKGSVIREILKMTMRPEVISFAGGLPSPATFPIEEMRSAVDRVLSSAGPAALQYGPTDGYRPLREWIADSLSGDGCRISPDHVLITSGSQQGLYLLGQVLLNKGDSVLVETPTYLGALQAFSICGASFVSVPSDEDGLDPLWVDAHANQAKLLYALPNYQNPTGRSLSTARRHQLVDVCARRNIPVIEDDPYGPLSYDGKMQPRLLSMNPDGVIYLGSFSKILTPGIRLGYVVAPPALMTKLEQAKQAVDLHTSQLVQMVAHEVIKGGFLDEHIPRIRELYASQCAAMLRELEEHMPAGVSWTVPAGGMFVWVTLPSGIDSLELFWEAIERNVAFVPGASFYATSPQTNTLRLSFVTVPKEKIREGIAVLANVIRRKLVASEPKFTDFKKN